VLFDGITSSGFSRLITQFLLMLFDCRFSIADPPGKPGLIEVWSHHRIADLGELWIQRPEVEIPLAPDQLDTEVLDGAVDLRD
jgi:hypothetical protein